jgi:5-methyltetrahydropteroyltriglutamate--homocysteine methyltransferase
MIPTEPIGSLPRPPELIEAVRQTDSDDPRLDPIATVASVVRRIADRS